MAPAPDPPRRLIYVHGIRPKPEPAVHAAVLRQCLLEGIRRADAGVATSMAAATDWLVLVSWSELFHPAWRDLAGDQPGIAALLADPAPGPERIAPLLGLGQFFVRQGHRLGDRYPALIRWLAAETTRTAIAEALRYFADRGGEARQIRGRLAAALRAAAGSRVLLATHSFGSVIGFDTLWELTRAGDPAARIEGFLSLGSPLGANYVRTRLLGARERGRDRYPAGIGRWDNLAARGDLTAMNRRFASLFGEMQRLGGVGAIRDRLDLINPFVGAEGLNVHRCYGYHVNAATGAVIADWWRGGNAEAAGLAP